MSTAGRRIEAPGPVGAYGPAVAGWLIPFALVVYLALRGGGYDAIVRSDVAIVIWLIVLIASAASLLPAVRGLQIPAPAWWAIGVLVALAGWTALSMIWSESAERSFEEVTRVVTYLGVFLLTLSLQREGALRRTVYAVAAAVAVIAVVALLARVAPLWFPANELVASQPADQARLNYPLNSWNAMAALMGIGMPLLLVTATSARHLASRAISTAAIPVVGLVTYLTLSRSGWAVFVVGLLAFVAFHPRRVELLPTAGLAGVATLICVLGVTSRDALQSGELSGTAFEQGDELLALVCVVCIGIALLRAAMDLSFEAGRLPRPSRVPKERAAKIAAGVATAALVAAVAIGAPGRASDGWEEFKSVDSPGGGTYRLESASGNGRYQYWVSALDQNGTAPVIGTGAGTFEFWWARNGEIADFTRYAHSLYLEMLGELGIVGLSLMLVLLGLIIGIAIRRAVRAPSEREFLAGALGCFCAFVVAAASDWVWQMTVIPVAVLIVAAATLWWVDPTVLVTSRSDSRPPTHGALAIGLIPLAVISLAVTIDFAISERWIQGSEDALEHSHPDQALSRAQRAADLQPFAAAPRVQSALALQEQGDLAGAAEEATAATEKESTNWETWWVLSQVENSRGDQNASQDAYETARTLNPRSPLLASPDPNFGG